MSVYAQEPNRASGSVYATPRSSGGSAYAKNPPAPPSPKSSGGGGILGGIGHFFAQTGRDLASTAEHIPGGIIAAGKAVSHDTAKGFGLLGGKMVAKTYAGRAAAGPWETPPIGKAVVQQTAHDFEHPLSHPGYTLLDALAALSLGGGMVARAGAVGKAIGEGGRLGDVAQAIVKPAVQPRIFQVGKETVPLQPSKSAAVRAGQALHDVVVKKALAKNPAGKVAQYGNWRLGSSLAETRRYQTAMQKVPAQAIQRSGARLPQEAQDALRLTAEQTTPQEAIAAAKREVAAGNVADNPQWIKRLENVQAKGYLKLDETKPTGQRVFIDPVAHPQLAALDAKVAAGSAERDAILAKYGEMTPQGLQQRINAPNIVHAGGEYEKPTPGKLGVPSFRSIRLKGGDSRLVAVPTMVQTKAARVARLQAGYDRAIERAGQQAKPYPNVHTRTSGVEVPAGPKTPGTPTALPPRGTYTPTVERLGAALSVAKDELASAEKAAATRVKPTGIVGAEAARPGRGFVSYAQTEPKGGTSPFTRSPGPVVGRVQSLISKSKPFTGAGLRAGAVPEDTTGIVSRGMLRAYRRANSEQFRTQLAGMGSDVKRSHQDVLVNTQEIKNAKVGELDRALLGQRKLNVGEQVAHEAGFRSWLQQAVPGTLDNFATEKTHPLGAPAPRGYKWVPRGLMGDLVKPAANPDPGWAVRRLDDVNAAVTAATVYIKPGHVVTRAGTNAFANIVQGSATPVGIAQSVKLWKELSGSERATALAAAGQQGYLALPAETTSAVGQFASGGARFWARHVDAPFRFNSIAYEARKAGFDTPAKFRQFLSDLQNPEGLNAAQRAKIDWTARRANREQIAYDRLTPFERQKLTRMFWFYPWTSASMRFAGNTLLEHPLKAAGLGQVGRIGQKTQASQLGQLPLYLQGLTRLGGSNAAPRVMDFSSATPYSTPAGIVNTLLQIPGHQTAGGYLNPAAGALARAAFELNQYGQSGHPSTPASFLAGLVAPTLPAGFSRDVGGGSKTFPVHGIGQAILHLLTKPAGPRTLNSYAAQHSAYLERHPRRG